MIRAIVVTAALAAAAASPAEAQTYIPCAQENGICRVPYATAVTYGTGAAIRARQVQAGPIACDNRTFGDPAPGQPKRCSYMRLEAGERALRASGGAHPGAGPGRGGYEEPRRRPDHDDGRAARRYDDEPRGRRDYDDEPRRRRDHVDDEPRGRPRF